MTVPDPYATAPYEPAQPARADNSMSPLLRAAIWVAIGALIAAAIVCVIWVLVGSQNGIVGRAFLTILLLAGFAGVAILDAHLAPAVSAQTDTAPVEQSWPAPTEPTPPAPAPEQPEQSGGWWLFPVLPDLPDPPRGWFGIAA